MNARLGALVVLLVAVCGAGSAEASRRHTVQKQSTEWTSIFGAPLFSEPSERASRSRHAARASRAERTSGWESSGSLGPRPKQWCGWWMRSQLGGGPAYNLAANWRHYGSASSPHVGAVVVWPHHVGIITGQAGNGRWIVRSGNYGGRVGEAARSIAGAVVRS